MTLELKLSGTLDHVDSEINSFESYTVGNFSYGGNLIWTLPLGVQLSTDLTASCNRGYRERAMNKNDYIGTHGSPSR